MFKKMTLIEELDYWCQTYEFNFQFWGNDYNQVFVSKGGISLFESSQNKTPKEAIQKALNYVRKINPTKQ